MELIEGKIARRSVALGPEDPTVIVFEMYDIVDAGMWKFDMALGLTGTASGFMALFLFCVFFWRRALVNRISLRLIFFISLFDFVQCIFQIVSTIYKSQAICRVYGSFIEIFMFSSIYLSSSIAFNLQMTFLRKSKEQLPYYTKYLYFVVPTLVATLQFAPQYIWAAKNGYCRAFDPIPPGTDRYIVYVIFVQMGIPTIFIFYNIVTSGWVIVTLYSKQRRISRALWSVTSEMQDALESTHNTGAQWSNSTAATKLSWKDQQQLEAVRRVYRACIRIALYPLAPLTWWIIFVVYYIGQYFYTFTWKGDAKMMARFVTLNWYSSCVVALTNFVVFLTDPAVVFIMKEVRRSLSQTLGGKKKVITDNHNTDYDSPKISAKKVQAVNIESYPAGSIGNDDISLGTADFDGQGPRTFYPGDAGGLLEQNTTYSTSVAGLYDDAVTRRVKGKADAQSFLDDM
ncbi:hypothetical protein COEREDRAFT_79845 [Coemansia reversa NRRL 1564]|uniref:G-protein coupled receptors family 1 profile domain-containing protein n=1 Tax=Coemansia reversa (strain ATCC 12441 / NRRL 1564) TaxID=763665 RepID=A0A2G5BH66_COERN|nr:hypothetical protein COEREDRAFT_79845 [Coemansia reversa NRRL 1564]|eukprot:PIA18368.1 hypothetical protein COEREDRAFT_79845 [Coemansia reversa NRRL 1564]